MCSCDPPWDRCATRCGARRITRSSSAAGSCWGPGLPESRGDTMATSNNLLSSTINRLRDPSLGPVGRSRNAKVFLDLAGPALRGLVLKAGRKKAWAEMPANHSAHFDWIYQRDQPEMKRLYEAA